ncbi:hemagglutinin repeat-containing protein [Massilia aquatica]|uniref:Filamentous hemagglutinin N-terminal domain-containing protein n=1 Tax=Massilia aquatica TaxID=2609000 RepID=A0ABX0ME05_9BURK|nr:hemagglutinin repeat-containing protein [Massilia aquatica]NHZ42497.1 filamentous hemagglutinin N-terminal domain-containing protein [Massilia aquatica]
MKSPIRHLLSKQTTLTAAERLVAEQLQEPIESEGGTRRPWARAVAQMMIVLQILQTALVVAPANAQVVAAGNAPAGQKPLVDAAANGVPIVLIAPPSAAGVSHNRYDQFNVGKQGLMLNNSREATGTQLGGIVNGNMQLGTTSARIILNEVTSGNPSRLNGYIEVAGQRADLVIANPNGITCDGCGFLNTAGRATLTTGTPGYNSAGQLDSLNVQRGVITIGAGGLNASNMEQLDLLARGIVIEGEVSTKNLQAVLGANKVLYGTLKATQQDGTGSAPRFAIDIAELGGMYANQIYLVATDKGLGVNSAGRIAALADNLTLSAQGDLTLKDNYSKKDVVLASTGKVTLTGQTNADQNVRIAAPDSIAIAKGGVLRAEQGVLLQTRQIDNSGSVIQKSASQALVLAAERINSSGSIYSATDLNLQAQAIDGSGGVLQAERALHVSAGSIAVDKQQWAANDAVTLNATELRATNGVLAAGTDLLLNAAGVLDVQGSKLSATRSADLRGQGVNSGAATVTAASVSVDAGKGKLDTTGGVLYASGGMDVRAAGIDNMRGKIVADDKLALNAGAGVLDNTGGTVASNNAVFTNVGSIRNREGTVSASSDLVLDGAVDNNKGKLITAGAFTFAGSAFDNAGGAIQAGKAVRLDASGAIDSAGGVIQSTDSSVSIQAGRLDNTKGAIGAAGDVSIGAQRLLGANGEISAGGKLALGGAALDLAGAKLASKGTLALAARDIVATAATVQAGEALAIKADNLSGASATMTSVKSVELVIGGNAALDKATIAANGNVTLDSANLNAQQLRVESGANVALKGATVDLRDATLSGARGVTLATGELLMQGGSAVSGGNLAITGQSQQGGMLSAAGDIDITMEKRFDLTGGAMLAGGDIAARAEGIVTDKAEVGGKHIVLDAGLQSLSNVGGTVVAESGGATGKPALVVRANGIDNSGGALSSDANAVFDANKQVFNNTGGNIVVAGTMELNAGALKNRFGSVATGSSIVMRDNEVDNTDGQLRSGKDVVIDASGKRFANERGLVEAQGAMTLSAAELNNNGGKLAANQTLRLAAGTLENSGGTVAAGKDLSLSVSGVIASANGTLRAGGPLSISTGRLDAAGALISSQAQIAIAADQAIQVDSAQIMAGGNIDLSAHAVQANRASITGNGAIAIDGSDSVNLAGADINANGPLTVKAVNSATLTGTQMATNAALQVSAASIDAGASRLSSAGDLGLHAADGALGLAGSTIASGARLDIDGAGIDAGNARLAARGDIAIDTRGKDYRAGGSTHRSETGAITVKAGNILAGGGSLNQGFIANGNITLDASGRIDTSNSSVSSGNNVVLNAGKGISTAGGALSAGGSATLSGATINNAKGAIAANGALTMVAREGGIDNGGGSILSREQLTLQTRTGLDRIAGKPVAAGGDTDLNNKGGSIVGVGGAVINSGSIDNSGGKIASGNSLVLDLGNSDLRGAKGSILSENALTLAARQIDLSGGQVRAGKGVSIVAEQIVAQGAAISAAGGDLLIDSKGSSVDASGSDLLASGLLSLKTGALNLGQSTLSSGAGTSIASAALDARQASIQAGGDIAIGSTAINAQDGSIGAGGKLAVNAASIKGGQYSAFKDLSVVSTGGIDLGKSALPGAQGGAFLTDAALSVKAQGLILDDGRAIGKNVTLDVGNGALSNRGGTILATDSAATAPALTLTSNGLDSTGGSIVSNGDLVINSGSGALDNSKGSIGALRTLAIKAGNVGNAGGSMVANSALGMQVQALDNQAGKIQAGTSLNLKAGDIDNRAGTLAGGSGIEITAGKVDSSAKALIGSNGNVSLHTKGLNNDASQVTAGGTLAIDAGPDGAISNVKGQINSDGAMTLASAGTLDNSGGTIAAGKDIGLTVKGALLNRAGAIQAGGDMLLSGTKGIDNDAGKIIADGALGIDGAALTTRKGLISTGKDLTLDLKTLGGALDNAGGQIQASGKASIAAKGVGNMAGILIANQELVLDTGKTLLDNRNGIVQSAKASVAIEAGEIASQGADSAIVAATDLTITGDKIDSGKGLISAGKDLSLIAQGVLNNAQGRITAGANATVQGKGIDNKAALLSAGKTLTVQAGNGVLVNSGGSILAGESLKLGAAGVQNLGGTLASNGDLNLTTDNSGMLDNSAGTIRSAQGSVSLTGGAVRNGAIGSATPAVGGVIAAGMDVTMLANGAVFNRDGSILAGNKLSIQASGALDNNNGELTGATALGVVANGITSENGSMLSNGELTANAGKGAFDNRQGVISGGGNTKLNAAGKFDNTDGKITTGANLLATTGAFDNVGGLVSAQGGASLTTAAFDGRKGEVIGQQALTINTQGARFDGSGARFASNGELSLLTGDAVLTGSTIAAGDSFAIQSSGANTRLDADGIKIAVTKNISMAGADVALNGSNLQAGNTITVGGANVGLNQAVLAANTAVNINGTDVQAVAIDIRTQGDISLQAVNTLDYRFGQFAAGNNAAIYGGGLVATANAKLAAGKRLSFGMGQALDFSALDFTYQFGTDLLVQAIGIRTGGVAISGDNLFFNAGSGVLDNTAGTLSATGVIEFKARGMINSGGLIAADHLVSLDAGTESLINDGGTIASAAGKIGIAGGNLLNKNGGNITAAEAVNVSVIGLADNSGGNIVSDGEVSLYAGTLVSNKGNIVSNKDKVTVNVRTFDNDGGTLSAKAALDVTATLDVSNKGGSMLAGADVTIIAKNGVNNQDGLIAATNKVVLTSSTGTLVNQGGTIQSDKAAVEIDAAKGIWNQKGEIYGLTGVQATTDADVLNMQGGRIASEGEIKLSSLKGKLDNTDGVVSSATKLIVAAKDVNNAGGVLSGLTSTKVTADSVNNNAGVIEAGTGGIVITAKTLTNDNSGTQRGIVSQGDIVISGGSVKQDGGYIGADGKLSIDGSSIDNTGGSTMLAMKELSLTGSVGINNQDGKIKSALDTTLKAPLLNNSGGTVFANNNLALDVAAIDNSNTNNGAFDKGMLASNTVTVNAATVGNVNGAIVALKNLKVTGTASIDNSGGQLSGETVAIDTADFINTAGRTDATLTLTAHMAKFSANGVMASTGTLRLEMDGDYTNQGLVAAENNLEIVLNNGKYTNKGTISAAKDLSLSANELNNYGSISATNTTINVGSLTNHGSAVVNSIGNTSINAGNTVNTGRIYGGNVVMTGGAVSNEANATIGARETLTVGGMLVNKPGANVISLGNMQLAGVVNAGGRIESGGNLNISGMLQNLNCVSGAGGNGQGASNCAAFGLEGGIGFVDQTTVEGMNRVTITPAGTNTEYAVEQLSYYTDDQHYYIHPSALHDKIEDYTKKTIDTRTTVASVMTKSQAGVVTAAGNISASIAINIDSQIIAGGNIGIGGGAEVGNGAIKSAGDSVNISTQGIKQVTYSGIKYDTSVGWTGGTFNKKHVRNYGPEQAFQDVGPTTSIDIAGVLYDSGGAAPAPAAPVDPTITVADPAKVVGTLGTGVPGNISASNGNTAAGDTTITKTGNVITYQNDSTTVGVNVGAINTNTSVQGVAAQGVTAGGAPSVNTVVAAGGTQIGPQVAGTSGGAAPVTTDAQKTGSGGAADVSVGTSAQPVVTGQVKGNALPGSVIAGNARAAQQTAIGDLTTSFARFAAARPVTVAEKTVAGVAGSDPAYINGRATDPKVPNVTLTSNADWKAPTGNLFSLKPGEGAGYLVETDPLFTDKNKWIGSDYFLTQLGLDPQRTLKRYGDGFVEQRAFADQLVNITGRNKLSGYENNEKAFTALMDAGVAYARQFQLTPGVALSEQQMAQLTTDIVWLQEETVTLPDGSTTLAMVPQVYLRRPQQGDLSTGGALIAGDNVTIRNQNGGISNSGTILAGYANARPTDKYGTVALDAQDVTNRGTIAGNVINIKATNDIANIGGRIAGLSNKGVDGSAADDSRVTLSAGRDITVSSTTRTRSIDTVGNNGTSTSSRTNIDRVATIAGGNVLIDAKGNFTARAAQVNAGANLNVLAGKNIDIAGVAEKHTLFVPLGGNTKGRTGYTNEASVTNIGSKLTAGNNIAIRAGGDATLSGSRVAAANDVGISGANVAISAVKDRTFIDAQTASRKRYDRAMTDDETLSGGLVLAKQNVTISATGTPTGAVDKDGKPVAQVGTGNLVLNAGNVVALNGTATLLANNDVTIQAVTTQHDSLNDSYSKSGNMVKTKTTTSSSTASAQQAQGSSIEGNSIAIVAGNGKDAVGNVNVIGSSVLADKNLTVKAGADINVVAATSTGSYSAATTVKESGLSGAKNGLGFSAGSSTVKTREDGTHVSQSDTGSVLGSTGGNISLIAGKNATIAGSDLIAGRPETGTTALNGNIDITAQNIAIIPGKDKAHQTSSVDTASKSVGVALVGTPLDTMRNLKDIKKNDSKFGRVNGTLSELADSSLTAPQVAVTFGKSKTSSSTVHDAETQSGSGLTASGNIRLTATGNGAAGADGKPLDGDILVSGSTISGGGIVKLSAERDVTVEASTDRSRDSSAATASSSSVSLAGPSLGDLTRSINGGPNNGGVTLSPYNQKRSSDSSDETSTRQKASLINGNSVELVSNKGDILVKGSGVTAKGDIALTAKDGKIDIVSGQDGTVLKETHSTMQLGDLGGNGSANTVGVKRSNDTLDTRKDQQNTIRSGVAAGGNLAITAKDDVAVRGSDLRAEGNVDIKGKNVILDPGVDQVSTKAANQSSQFGVTVALSGYAVDATNAIKQAAAAHDQQGNDKLAGIYALKAALTVANGTGMTGSTPAGASGTGAGTGTGTDTGTGMVGVAVTKTSPTQAAIKATVSVGGSSSDSTTNNSALQNKGSSVSAGQNLSITATGDGSKDADGKALNGDITAHGAVLGGKDVTLDAARNITLASAQDTSANDSKNASHNASIGVGFGLGGAQNGFTLELAAGQSRGNANGSATTNQDTSVTASNVLTIKSGKDTTLAGAEVKGDKVLANIGGDLNIVSVQDIDNYKSRETSSGASVSICVPPFCVGSSSGSVNAARSTIDSTFAGVNQQSGIYAGKQGFDVTVKNNTDLVGGVIASAAGADKNKLTTGTLTQSDVKNAASYDSDSLNLSYSSGASAGSTIKSNIAGNLTPAQRDSAASTTKSAIGAGTVVITDDKGQLAATGKSADDTVAGLNRDTANSAGTIGKIFDLKQLQSEREVARALTDIAKQVTPLIATKVGDIGAKQVEDAQKLAGEYLQQAENATANNDPVAAAAFTAKANDALTTAANWGDNGIYRVGLHTATQGIVGGITGGSSGALSNGAGVIGGNLGQQVGEASGEAAADKLGLAVGSPERASFVNAYQETGAAIGGALVGAAAAAANGADGNSTLLAGLQGGFTAEIIDLNNRQLHQNEIDLAKKYAKAVAKAGGISEAEALARIERQLLRWTNNETNLYDGGRIDELVVGVIGKKGQDSATGTKWDYNNYDKTHPAEYFNSSINAQNIGKYSPLLLAVNAGITPAQRDQRAHDGQVMVLTTVACIYTLVGCAGMNGFNVGEGGVKVANGDTVGGGLQMAGGLFGLGSTFYGPVRAAIAARPTPVPIPYAARTGASVGDEIVMRMDPLTGKYVVVGPEVFVGTPVPKLWEAPLPTSPALAPTYTPATVPAINGGVNTTSPVVSTGTSLVNSVASDSKPATDNTATKTVVEACCCFPAGTPVVASSGTVAIEQIQVGQLVYARNPETGATELKPVTQLMVTKAKPLYRLVTQDFRGVNESMDVTDNHPYWVKDKGWVNAIDLERGMELENLQRGQLTVQSLTSLGRSAVTYNFTVADFHTYFAGEQSAFVHNCSDVCGPANVVKNTVVDVDKNLPLKAPNPRHYADKVKQNTNVGDENTVIDRSVVDISADVLAINLGKAEKIGRVYHLENGRAYSFHDDILYPVSGPGLYPLDRGEFKALGVLNKFGESPQAYTIMKNMGIPQERISKALEVYKVINK